MVVFSEYEQRFFAGLAAVAPQGRYGVPQRREARFTGRQDARRRLVPPVVMLLDEG
jgi:hypothetical protein